MKRTVMTLAAICSLSACNGGSVSPTTVNSSGALTPAVHTAAVILKATPPPYTFYDLGAGPNGGFAVAQGANGTTQGGNYYYESLSCGKACSTKVYHAAAWAGPGSASRDINPGLPYFVESWVYGGSGSNLVGYGITDQGGYFGYPHALLWRGTSLAWKDINPTGYQYSYAYGMSGTSIAGSAFIQVVGQYEQLHAMVWSLSNLAQPTDLHPSTTAYSESEALGVSGTNQVGYAQPVSSTPTQHAMLWSGTPASAVDLTPADVTSALAWAAYGSTQVGCGVPAPATQNHALLWRGTAASMVDLNPSTFTSSCARAAYKGIQAGYGAVGAYTHAVVWTGSAQSAVDLQLSLPSNYTNSEVYAIDSKGDLIGAAYNSTGGGWH